MSDEQLKAFLEAVKADAGLQEKLKAAGDADAVVAIAKTAGFVISDSEWFRAQAEISEDELEGVVGGGKCGQLGQNCYSQNSNDSNIQGGAYVYCYPG